VKYQQLVDAPCNARLAQTTAPASEPRDVVELKQHIRQDISDEDDYLGSLISASRQWIEMYLGRQLITATWTLTLDAFPADGVMELPRPPLLTVASVKYYDVARVQQTFAASGYHTHVFAGPEAGPGRIELAPGTAWPTVYSGEGAVQIAFTAGYGATGSTVPPQIRQAILLHAAEMYERREQVIVGAISTPVAVTVERLLWPLRVF